MKNIKYILSCLCITFAFIIMAELFLVGLAYTFAILGMDDGSIAQLLPYTNYK